MFVPPRCPYRRCRAHLHPEPELLRPHGHYLAKCRPHPIPRFRCLSCLRTFSRQTFRMDYRDHRPDLNWQLLQSLASGLGLRQSSRNLRLSLRCTELKFRKLARHARRLNLNLRGDLPADASFQMDELETFEGRRNTRPLTVPVLIEKETRFIVWAESAKIRPRGKMTPARLRAVEEDEKRFGKRLDWSLYALRRTLGRARDLAKRLERVFLETDKKTVYERLAKAAFGKDRLCHSQTSSRLPRTIANPLFAINHTEAMARDLMGRLRRESWLVSKKRRFLDLGLQIFIAYRNYVRRRFNYDHRSPAQMLGFAPRRLREPELLSWRQDWGERSIHPLARGSESVVEFASRPGRAA